MDCAPSAIVMHRLNSFPCSNRTATTAQSIITTTPEPQVRFALTVTCPPEPSWWSILVVIGAGLGIAGAMEKTGAAAAVAQVVVAATSEIGPMGALVVIYVVCLLMAETLHHNAAVAIMFPVAIAAARQVGADPRGFVMAVAVAGCCAFASPVTYQTHLIVYGTGNYRFRDFIRVGLPLNLVCAGVALTVIPRIWPF